MRPPRVRFTVRWLLVAVAMAAVACFGVTMSRRRADHLSKADDYRSVYEASRFEWREFTDAARENQEILDRLTRGGFTDYHDLDPDRSLRPEITLGGLGQP